MDLPLVTACRVPRPVEIVRAPGKHPLLVEIEPWHPEPATYDPLERRGRPRHRSGRSVRLGVGISDGPGRGLVSAPPGRINRADTHAGGTASGTLVEP
jgi:hypothetical protein